MKAQITVTLNVENKEEGQRVQKAFETMDKHFKAKGIIHMEQLFLHDAFIRNLVKMKLNKK